MGTVSDGAVSPTGSFPAGRLRRGCMVRTGEILARRHQCRLGTRSKQLGMP